MRRSFPMAVSFASLATLFLLAILSLSISSSVKCFSENVSAYRLCLLSIPHPPSPAPECQTLRSSAQSASTQVLEPSLPEHDSTQSARHLRSPSFSSISSRNLSEIRDNYLPQSPIVTSLRQALGSATSYAFAHIKNASQKLMVATPTSLHRAATSELMAAAAKAEAELHFHSHMLHTLTDVLASLSKHSSPSASSSDHGLASLPPSQQRSDRPQCCCHDHASVPSMLLPSLWTMYTDYWYYSQPCRLSRLPVWHVTFISCSYHRTAHLHVVNLDSVLSWFDSNLQSVSNNSRSPIACLEAQVSNDEEYELRKQLIRLHIDLTYANEALKKVPDGGRIKWDAAGKGGIDAGKVGGLLSQTNWPDLLRNFRKWSRSL